MVSAIFLFFHWSSVIYFLTRIIPDDTQDEKLCINYRNMSYIIVLYITAPSNMEVATIVKQLIGMVN